VTLLSLAFFIALFSAISTAALDEVPPLGCAFFLFTFFLSLSLEFFLCLITTFVGRFFNPLFDRIIFLPIRPVLFTHLLVLGLSILSPVHFLTIYNMTK
jgi:hypothetical protein